VLQVAGANRLLFGTDSSYFPRGWNRTVFDDQLKCVETLNVGEDTVAKIFGENFDRIFPL
ncbi:MAG TPA: amidohydrolase family protein, partial [Acidobacteriota bacterium]|nr:amidohydrolase family protein [Acidobacteriota bacterium]